MKKGVMLLLGVCAIALAAVAILWARTDLGVPVDKVEQDARAEQQIPAEWSVAQDAGDSMVALVFYSEDESKFSISIYTKPSEASERYHYRFGGDSSMIMTGIVEYAFEDCSEQAFMSMNTQQSVRAVVQSDAGVETIELDGDKPFVLVLDVDVDEVTFYDAIGNIAGDYENPGA